jgi:hypothetical protein
MDVTKFAPQEIVLGKTPHVVSLKYEGYEIPDSFYTKGYCVIDGVKDEKEAQIILEKLISSIDTKRLPIYSPFKNKLQLAKRDEIPVCGDSVETSFQALHFDMGQPLVSEEPQNMYLLTGLHITADKKPTTAKTRVISLKGLFAGDEFGTEQEIETKILKYVNEHGDGWIHPDKVNTHRISCFARIVDAVAGTSELADYFDKSMAQWFADPKDKYNSDISIGNEKEFYIKRGVNLEPIAENIVIQPGQLLVVDNMRTAHGRVGKREEKETWQFMYGVHNAAPQDIDWFRSCLIEILKSA